MISEVIWPWGKNKILTEEGVCQNQDSRYREHRGDGQRGVKAYVPSGNRRRRACQHARLRQEEANVVVRPDGKMP